MKDVRDEAAGSHIGLHGQKAALQVICLGNSGGPSEESVTAFLVRSVASNWAKGSLLAVDAGSHLGPIIRILERSFPTTSKSTRKVSNSSNGVTIHPSSNKSHDADDDDDAPKPEAPTVLDSGPFAGLRFPHETAGANALHVLRTFISTYLITHAHLDHVSGFAINTAAFNGTSRPKTLAALPSTVNAIKQHIFNDVIWPNLTDEDGGVGFVTFQRLKEGGDVMVGEGEGRGYIDVCDGLGARAFKVSHGVCTKSPPSHQHRGSIAGIADAAPPYNGSIAGTSQDLNSAANMARTLSVSAMHSQPGTPGSQQRQSFHAAHASPHLGPASESNGCVVDSTAYFLRDEETEREVLIFGDVEPDSLSLTPRTFVVWQEAARKIVQGVLGGIFIECSYDDSQADAILFGHLCPRHLVAELQNLAQMVVDARAMRAAEQSGKKRKRSIQLHVPPNGLDLSSRLSLPEAAQKRTRSLANRTLVEEHRRNSLPEHAGFSDSDGPMPVRVSTPPANDSLNHYHFQPLSTKSTGAATEHAGESVISPRSVSFPKSVGGAESTENANTAGFDNDDLPLGGIKVVIIHVKDTYKDGPHVSENILAELREHESRLREEGSGLGCEFIISQSGESYWF